MCAGCRKRKSVHELIRLIRTGEGLLQPDLTRRQPGRGAHLCADPACLAVAIKRGALKRSFKRPIDVTAGALGDDIAEAFGRRLRDLAQGRARSAPEAERPGLNRLARAWSAGEPDQALDEAMAQLPQGKPGLNELEWLWASWSRFTSRGVGDRSRRLPDGG